MMRLNISSGSVLQAQNRQILRILRLSVLSAARPLICCGSRQYNSIVNLKVMKLMMLKTILFFCGHFENYVINSSRYKKANCFERGEYKLA